ncbi:periphilin-1 isoform X2 [Latimeria chalumnae]|nr:PREDICTED: periphilin-1 isoform X2 [Latimeria chalumnae]XP_005993236.1 PREDICTED: periphilin-1 isoform X2 [Latimeria chalumnae]|eukprot:XP_005993235.1 PREDICTED: periphilin-1 isoform X2 [Latimeria chalumnae]
MWSEGTYEYDERNPRERFQPARMQSGGGYQRIVNIISRKTLLDRPSEVVYNRDYGHGENYRQFPDENRKFGFDRRSGPQHRWEDQSYRWPRDEHHESHGSRQSEYRESRETFRRKGFNLHPHARDRSPHKRGPLLYRGSPAGHRNSPHSRSGSSVSSRSFSPERSKPYSSNQSQPIKSKERSTIHPLNTSRDTSPSSSTGLPASRINTVSNLDKSSKPAESLIKEPVIDWGAENLEKTEECDLPEISQDYEDTPVQEKTPQLSSEELLRPIEESKADHRSAVIAAKTKEIEQVYKQDCETFGMVVKMLIDKDPSLEKPIQFALKENLNDIGDRCIEELKRFIAEYDTSEEHSEGI